MNCREQKAVKVHLPLCLSLSHTLGFAIQWEEHGPSVVDGVIGSAAMNRDFILQSIVHNKKDHWKLCVVDGLPHVRHTGENCSLGLAWHRKSCLGLSALVYWPLRVLRRLTPRCARDRYRGKSISLLTQYSKFEGFCCGASHWSPAMTRKNPDTWRPVSEPTGPPPEKTWRLHSKG